MGLEGAPAERLAKLPVPGRPTHVGRALLAEEEVHRAFHVVPDAVHGVPSIGGHVRTGIGRCRLFDYIHIPSIKMP
jgi:hypothetical protein